MWGARVVRLKASRSGGHWRLTMKWLKLIALCVTALLGIAATGQLYPRVPRANAQTAGWSYQVGVDPGFAGNAASHLYSALYYCPSCNVFPSGDTGYVPSVWNAAEDQEDGNNLFQVGYAFADPSYYANPTDSFIQTSLYPDSQGNSYVVCVPPYTSPSVGIYNQPGGGCDGPASALGLADRNYYYVEIFSDQNCAQGAAGCIYNCNGNWNLAIDGRVIAHFADCLASGGMNGIYGAVLEPIDTEGITPEDGNQNLYESYSYLGDIEAIISGTAYPPNSLAAYCYSSPPTGAGSVIESNTEATLTTIGGTCPGAQATVRSTRAGAIGAPLAPPRFEGARTVAGSLPAPARGPLPHPAVQPKLVFDPAGGKPLPHAPIVPPARAGSAVVPTPTPSPGPR